MTTIAADFSAGVMAADSRVVVDDLGAYGTSKLRRIKGSIFGCCGTNCGKVAAVLDWIEAGKPEKKRPNITDKDDFFLLEMRSDGLYFWDTDLLPERLDEPHYGIGSGRKIAIYCMRYLGMDPTQAVHEACKVDVVYSAPPVRWMNMDGTEGRD
jgi:hypothetical protein